MTNSNIDTFLSNLRAEIRDLGRTTAIADDAKAILALMVTRAAHDGYIAATDAKELYVEYITAKSKKSIHEHKVDGINANASKLRSLISMGALPSIDGPALLDKVTDIRKDMRESEQKCRGAFDAFYEVAKAQLKSPDAELSDAELRDLCTVPEKDKSLIDELVADYKRLSKRHDQFPSPSIEAAVHAIGDAIVEAGGELPPMTKEDKAKAAFIRKAQAMGYVVA